MEPFHSLVFFLLFSTLESSLYPRESPVREVKKLDGLWKFRTAPDSNPEKGFEERWYERQLEETGPVIPMPVPSSFNDITQEKAIRDHIGWVWYQTSFYVPSTWFLEGREVILRFGSVNYVSYVYLNGAKIGSNIGGHLPFEFSLEPFLRANQSNLLTIAVNNTLTPETLPQGTVVYKEEELSDSSKNFYEYSNNFDFFNYAGIHRSVHLTSVPRQRIEYYRFNISVSDHAVIEYSVEISNFSTFDPVDCIVEIYDSLHSKIIAQARGTVGRIIIPKTQLNLWWPFGANENSTAYLYRVDILLRSGDTTMDHYPTHIGIRTVEVREGRFLLNGKPFYFTGFGKHEDSDIRGRGFDFPIMVKDFNLMKWIGANSFRTSHYPYSEEMMDMADAMGFVVIDECPAVGLTHFNQILLNQHLNTIERLVKRDYNHPSVVMWSIANEPESFKSEAKSYFAKVVDATKNLDPSRPVTAAINADVEKDLLAPHLDVIMINRYYAWYSDTGYTQVITKKLIADMERWFKVHRRPIMISEYGADSLVGLHQDPSFVFTEDYQTELMIKHFDAFDVLRKKDFFVGEMIWNFADFRTNQGITRVLGNRKGIFTRTRQPKAAAKVLRCRYIGINAGVPIDDNMYCPVKDYFQESRWSS